MEGANDDNPQVLFPDAVCAGQDPNLWFPERGDDDSVAMAACDVCPHLLECGERFVRQKFGIWGGLGVMARRSVRRAMAKGVPYERAALRLLQERWANDLADDPSAVGQLSLRLLLPDGPLLGPSTRPKRKPSRRPCGPEPVQGVLPI